MPFALSSPETPLPFGPVTAGWFTTSFPGATGVQQRGWARIAAGDHSLLIAPTGSGKTLAAFLWSIDRLTRLPADAELGVRVLYVSPLKALAYDIERNLRTPLAGIQRVAEAFDQPLRLPELAVRTGDTPQAARRQQTRRPAEILVTTPESLFLILLSNQRETLRTVETVIIDEIHALAPTKRGAHLALSLEHLETVTHKSPQRIGLSATVRPAELVARFLGGDRPVSVVDASEAPNVDLRVVVPVPDMTAPAPEERDPEKRGSIWPAIYDDLLRLIRGQRSTIVFVNSRGLCERLARRLNEVAGEELVLAHHGSISHKRRRYVEDLLKAGQVRGLVATSSLELGIDMGAVDLVVLVESPGSVARGLQRVGRAGHQVGATSLGRIYPKHRGDLLEAAIVSKHMREGRIEALSIPKNPLDVLAQQVVALTAARPWAVDRLLQLVRRTANFAGLSRDLLVAVLDMLSGHYPSTEFADLTPRVNWDRQSDVVEARPGAAMLARVSGGTIPDRGLYGVFVGGDGPRVGELDEEMVYETRIGQIVILGASSWRVEEITRDQVRVSPAPGEPGRLPFWKGEGPGRPLELGKALGALTRELADKPPDAAAAWLESQFDLEPRAAKNLVTYVHEQRETAALPTDRDIVVERFRDEVGDWRVCLLSPFGARVHAPWALAIEAVLSGNAGFEVQSLWSDDGIALRFADAETLPDLERLIPPAAAVQDLVVAQLAQSALFASQFRENAARALLLPRRRPGTRTPLWAQRLRAQHLQAAAQAYPAFPIILETYRTCLQDVFDLPALGEILTSISRGDIRVHAVESLQASPFARSLVFAWVANYMYDGGAPVAERKLHALSLDRQLLRELLGQEALRELLDPVAVEAVAAELQQTAPERHVRSPDALHDLLRRLGDLSAEEIADRGAEPQGPWVTQLEQQRRAVRLMLGRQTRWIAAEDAALYRDGLQADVPSGVPDAFLEPAPDALAELVRRWARTHAPFVDRDLARRWGVPVERLAPVLQRLEREGVLLHGDFHPEGAEREWCDPEVLRRLRQRTLTRLRSEVEPVEPPVLARFLPAWHGVGEPRGSVRRVEAALAQLEGLPLSFKDLETAILPARVSDYHPGMLDELGASGQVVWVGRGALGKRDGRVCIYRRDRLRLWFTPPDEMPSGALHQCLLGHLEAHGASFFFELAASCPDATEPEIVEALWDLAWAGLVTNDTFRPLRTLGPLPSPGRRSRFAGPAVRLGGRWSRLKQIAGAPPTDTERLHAWCTTLLQRHGVVSREVLELEELPGGFAALYPVLRQMEESGKVRRGFFVDGMSGAQFAWPGAVERLRASRTAEDVPPRLLAATDPANPYGWLNPWPEVDEAAGPAPRRAPGTYVALVGTELAFYLDHRGRRLVTFPAAEDEAVLRAATSALKALAARTRGKLLRVETIDGQPARLWAGADVLRAAGFGADYRGLALEG